jgi:hypothetical protein
MNMSRIYNALHKFYFYHIRWKIFKKIYVPNEARRKALLEYTAFKAIKQYQAQNNGQGPSKIWLNCCMFEVYQRTKQQGMDLRMPYFWYIHGVEVVWEDFTDKIHYICSDGTKIPLVSPHLVSSQ